MEDLVCSPFKSGGNAFKRRRTQHSRRPRSDAPLVPEGLDHSSSSPSHQSDQSKASDGDHAGRKEFDLNQCDSPEAATRGVEECVAASYNGKADDDDDDDDDEVSGRIPCIIPYSRGHQREKRCSEGILAPANWGNKGSSNPPTTTSSPPAVFESKVKRVKLKVGGVTRTIQANSKPPFDRSSPSSDASYLRKKQTNQRSRGLQGVPWKDFSKNGFFLGKEEKGININKKSKRNPAKRPEQEDDDNDDDDNDDDDDEARYLEKLRSAKVSAGQHDEDPSKKMRLVQGNGGGVSMDKKKPKGVCVSEDAEMEEEEGRKKRRKTGGIPVDHHDHHHDVHQQVMSLTTRQRALQSWKDPSIPSASLVEFPDGLPSVPSRKQKEKLSEVEQQLKKAEAAQRRRMQVEKAAKESEAEAIRKILGQDSSRKKREDKMKKRREELAQEKAANALMGCDTVRWVMGLSGTTVTFPSDTGLPSIFNKRLPSSSSPNCTYPPSRECCVGPSCGNPYKYRDSKTKLPLCSLQCYRAIQEEGRPKAAAC